MTKWKSIPLATAVFYEGQNPIFDRAVYHVFVDDDAGGPFIRITTNDEDNKQGEIGFDLEALEVITVESRKLIKIHEKTNKENSRKNQLKTERD